MVEGNRGSAPILVSTVRLWRTLHAYARYGATALGGVDRPVFSPADLDARRRFADDCRALGLVVRVDAAANVVGVRAGREPDLPVILLGSHLDSVPDGGRFDGALGVCCALEVLRTLIAHDVATRHPVGIISLTGEEATSFGTSTFGSRALAGRLPEFAAHTLPDGRTLRAALAEAGGDWDAISTARDALGPLALFVEAHIEQGTRLERAGRALAVVSSVCGIYRQRLTFRGEAGHAGTTAMSERHDALRAAARLVLSVAGLPAQVAAADPSATATVGSLRVVPNSPNVIPGAVTLQTDLRATDESSLRALAHGAASRAREAAAAEGVGVEVDVVLDQAPVAFDPRLRAVMRRVVQALDGEIGAAGETGDGDEYGELASGAGHDAVHLGALAPAGMLFVRCAGGVSHRPDESVTPADAALAAQALLDTVRELDAHVDPAPSNGPGG